MTEHTTAEMFATEDHIRGVASEYAARLEVVRERIDAYDCTNGRRYATDEWHDVRRCFADVQAWLAGNFDRSYAGQFGSLEAFRAHYADSSLSAALHHLVWAEHFAGLTTRDEARAADPWR